MFLWDFFAEGTKSGLTSLHAKGYLLTKARVPPWILVVDVDVERRDHARRVLGRHHDLSGRRRPTARCGGAVRLRCYCAALIAIVTGFSLAASVLFLRYRDLNQVWEVVVQAGFFLAPIIYPLEILPERFHFYLYIWPPTPVIEFSRAALVAGVMPTTTAHLYLACGGRGVLPARSGIGHLSGG